MSIPDGVSRNEKCHWCGSRVLDGGRFAVMQDGWWAFQCRACTVIENDYSELNELIDRLTRNPSLAAKVRKALGVE